MSALNDIQLKSLRSQGVSIDDNTLNSDAWQRTKTVQDVSLFHGLFTNNVPAGRWIETVDEVATGAQNHVSSVNGKLRVTGSLTGQAIKLRSSANPRYEPNRGHLYSSSIFLPNCNATGTRDFGLFTRDAGLFFRLREGILYAVRRTTIDTVVTDHETVITLPKGCNLEFGNTYDIQYQWRGVGDVFFFINQQLVLRLNLLGTSTELSTYNPASPVAFECVRDQEDIHIECGCVDVSSEGGANAGKTYGSLSTNSDSGSVPVSGFNTPVLVVHSKTDIGAFVNTRDLEFLRVSGYGDQRNVVRLWSTRNPTAITLNDQVYTDFRDGHIEYVTYNLNADGTPLVGTPMTFDTSKALLLYSGRQDQDKTLLLDSNFSSPVDVRHTPGEYWIFTIHRETGGNTTVGLTYEFGELI